MQSGDAGVAKEAPSPGPGPDAGPDIPDPLVDLQPRAAEGRTKHAFYRRRAALVP